MRPEEIAYKDGFRVSKNGRLYKAGESISYRKEKKRPVFSLNTGIKTVRVGVARLQAYQKFQKKLYDVQKVIHLNGDKEDCSFDNIAINPDYGKLNPTQKKAEQVAYDRGYRVTKTGNVLDANGNKVILSKNSAGYYIFGTGSKKYLDNPFYNVSVHRLQAFQKFGLKLYKSECVRHVNGDKSDNTWGNILVGSYVDNYHDIPKKSRKNIVNKMAITKRGIPQDTIDLILKLRSEEQSYKEISEITGLSKSWVWMISNNKTTYNKV